MPSGSLALSFQPPHTTRPPHAPASSSTVPPGTTDETRQQTPENRIIRPRQTDVCVGPSVQAADASSSFVHPTHPDPHTPRQVPRVSRPDAAPPPPVCVSICPGCVSWLRRLVRCPPLSPPPPSSSQTCQPCHQLNHQAASPHSRQRGLG